MMHLTLAAVPFVMKVVVAVWALVAVLLILIVLIQKGRGGGLASAFGGLGTSLLGTKTGDFLTWVTICLVAVWLILSVVAVKWFKPQTSDYLQQTAPMQRQAAPVTPVTPETKTPAAPVQPANTPANQ
jgi:preprotein translocase subunit SecG